MLLCNVTSHAEMCVLTRKARAMSITKAPSRDDLTSISLLCSSRQWKWGPRWSTPVTEPQAHAHLTARLSNPAFSQPLEDNTAATSAQLLLNSAQSKKEPTSHQKQASHSCGRPKHTDAQLQLNAQAKKTTFPRFYVQSRRLVPPGSHAAPQDPARRDHSAPLVSSAGRAFGPSLIRGSASEERLDDAETSVRARNR
ncbi:hypothetical protein MHYP_G00075320 [Metynnis hypsauchen]